MVTFTCNTCGESVKKPKVESHYRNQCPDCYVLTCMDCGKDFHGDDYMQHNSCISEAEKYQGALYQPKQNQSKGAAKQATWLSALEAMIVEAETKSPHLKKYLQQMAAFGNVPRKLPKFKRWCKNSLRLGNPKLAEELFNTIAEYHKREKEAKGNGQKKQEGSKPKQENDANAKEEKKEAEMNKEEATKNQGDAKENGKAPETAADEKKEKQKKNKKSKKNSKDKDKKAEADSTGPTTKGSKESEKAQADTHGAPSTTNKDKKSKKSKKKKAKKEKKQEGKKPESSPASAANEEAAATTTKGTSLMQTLNTLSEQRTLTPLADALKDRGQAAKRKPDTGDRDGDAGDDSAPSAKKAKKETTKDTKKGEKGEKEQKAAKKKKEKKSKKAKKKTKKQL